MSEPAEGITKSLKQVIVLLSAFGLISLAIHLFTNFFSAYGIFRDELYYIACSKRLDAGYVDQPPFSIYMLNLSINLFGKSVFAIRILPSLFSAFTVFLTGLLTFKLGGKIQPVILSCTAIILAPIFLAMHSIYSMNAYDYFFWIAAVYLIVLIIQSGNKRIWYLLGITMGLGLLNKIGFLWFGAGLFLGLLLTDPTSFKKKEVYAAGIIAFIIFSPFIFWNITHDFAHLEFIRNATRFKYSGITRLDFVLGQILLLNPLSLPIWIAGISYFLFYKPARPYRIIGIIYVVSFLILLINGSAKPEYLGPAYASLFSGGAVLLENIFQKRKYIVKVVLPGLIFISGVVFMPLVIPVLPVEVFIKYQSAIGMEPGTMEGKELRELPQFYSDMFGWENMASTVSEVYNGLSTNEKKRTIIFAHNYGEAGAMEYFSDKYPLPPVVCPHNSYWYWLDETPRFEIVIVIGGELEGHIRSCESVDSAAVVKHKYAMPYESELPIYICRKLKKAVKDIWNESKIFI